MRKNYKKPDWAVDQIIRENGVVEDICKHGVGHPNLEYLKERPNDKGIHGCCEDSCCFTGPAFRKKVGEK
jgi:hypothetical protein